MAGVLQTGAFVNGEWISENLDINTVLKRNENKPPPELAQPDEPEKYGLLAQTLIESPILRWILPVNIRGSEGDRDVAFISDNAVQIRSLDEKGQLQDIARRADFGSRIRNARIVGSIELGTKSMDHSISFQVNEDMPMEGVWAPKSTEYIVLALESGIIVFLFAYSNEDGELELLTVQHNVSRPMLSEQPGTHIAVDPSSQYMALSGAENVFAVYALRLVNLPRPCIEDKPVSPVESERYLHVDGVIHKMEFLYPSSDDPSHIILLLLVVCRGSTRMYVYDWVAGQSLRDIRSNFKKGTTVVKQHRMPLLLIPLRIRSAVLLVSEGAMAVCNGILEGTPTYTKMDIKFVKTSPRYLGNNSGNPLWTSWFRPLRTHHYSKTHDDLYLAREDGAVLFMENSTEYFVQAQMDMYVDCNIDTAFACLDNAAVKMKYGDRLLVGGDSCNGGLYFVEARSQPVLLRRLPNWSPTIDFVIAKKISRYNEGPANHFGMNGLTQMAKPDQIFALTGRGIDFDNALSEIRYGHEAYLRVESELEVPIDDVWYLPSNWNMPIADHGRTTTTLMLLSVGNQSILLQSSADDSSIEQIEQSSTWIDLTSRTITATAYLGVTVQVTNSSIIISADSPLDDSPKAMYRRDSPTNSTIMAAHVYKNELVLAIHLDGTGALHLSVTTIRLGPEDGTGLTTAVSCIGTWISIDTFPNIVSVTKRRDNATYDVLWDLDIREQVTPSGTVGTPLLSLSNAFKVEVGNAEVTVEAIRRLRPPGPITLQLPRTCISMSILQNIHSQSHNPVLLLAGHRDGLLVMVHLTLDTEGHFIVSRIPSYYTIGSTSVVVKSNAETPNIALVCCDSKIWRISFDGRQHSDPILNRIWFTDVDEPYDTQPPVSQICALPQGLLLASRNKIMIAVLDPNLNPRAVPRPISLQGQPSRLLFDDALGVLLVIVEINSEFAGQKKLICLDPETGDEIPLYWDENNPAVNQQKQVRDRDLYTFSGAETVLCMSSIRNHKHARTSAVIFGVKDRISREGLLVIFHLHRPQPHGSDDAIVCTAHKDYPQVHGPVYALAGLHNNVFFASGDTIRTIELTTKTPEISITSIHLIDLPSPAVSMSITAKHWLNVHTAKHSLLTYKFSVDIESFDPWGSFQVTPQFSDELDRDGLDHIVLTSSTSEKSKHVIMISDKACSVAGLSYAKSMEPPARNQRTLFEAELSASIVKFGCGNIRPSYDKSWKPDIHQSEDNTVSNQNLHLSEVLGMTLDGSLRHFTIIGETTTKLLCFLQDRVRQIEAASQTPITPYRPFFWRSDPDPMANYVDGDSLQKLLRHGWLERLFPQDWERDGDDKYNDEEDGGKNMETREFVNGFLTIMLMSLDERSKTEIPAKASVELIGWCREEVYGLLESLLRPVL